MKNLKRLHEERLLLPLVDNREDVVEAFEEMRLVLNDWSQRDENLLLEIGVIDNLSNRQIKKLFQAVSDISKGISPKRSGVAEKMVDSVKNSFKKLNNAPPADNFEDRAIDIINKWKDNLNPKDKVIDAAKALGRYAKKNPAKSAFVLGVLGTLTTALGTPAFSAAASTALNTAMELAKKSV